MEKSREIHEGKGNPKILIQIYPHAAFNEYRVSFDGLTDYEPGQKSEHERQLLINKIKQATDGRFIVVYRGDRLEFKFTDHSEHVSNLRKEQVESDLRVIAYALAAAFGEERYKYKANNTEGQEVDLENF